MGLLAHARELVKYEKWNPTERTVLTSIDPAITETTSTVKVGHGRAWKVDGQESMLPR